MLRRTWVGEPSMAGAPPILTAPGTGELFRLIHRDPVAAAPTSVAPDDSLTRAFARTQAAVDRGELRDIASLLASLGGSVETTTGLLAGLATAAHRRPSEDSKTGRRVLHLNEVVDHALRTFELHSDGMTLIARFRRDLSAIVGSAAELRGALACMLAYASRIAAPDGVLRAETSEQRGALRGETIVRLDVVAVRRQSRAQSAVAAAGPEDLDLALAAGVVVDHGGALSAEILPDGARITVELPAV